MIACTDIPCSNLGIIAEQRSTGCSFDGDPDIRSDADEEQAGIGVLLSFITAGVVTFLISTYMFFFIDDGLAHELTNKLDSKVVKHTRHLFSWIRRNLSFIDAHFADMPWMASFESTLVDPETLSQVVIMLSDQQLVLGLSILIVGYVKFMTMTQYHFAIVSALSNISFVVHVSTVPVVKGALFGKGKDEAKWYNFKRLWRAIAKLAFDFGLLISFLPTGNYWWLADYGLPTYCVWINVVGGNYHGVSVRVMIADIVLLCWGILYELNAFFPIFEAGSRGRLMTQYLTEIILAPRRLYMTLKSHRIGQHSKVSKLILLPFEYVLWVLAVFVFVCCEVIASQTLRLTRSWAMLISNTARIFRLRAQAPLEGRVGNENAWSYGQAVSMFMLILPTFLAIELCYDKYVDEFRLERHKSSSFLSERTSQDGNDHTGPSEIPDGYRRPSREDTEERVGLRLQHAQPRKVKLRNARLAVSAPPAKSSTVIKLAQLSMNLGLGADHVADKLKNRYYFGYPDHKLDAAGLENELYEKRAYEWSVIFLMSSIFVTVTVWAIKGWAF